VPRSCRHARVVAPPPGEMVERERQDLARVREGGGAFEAPVLIFERGGLRRYRAADG
jgi:hypothetical protein